MKGRLIIICILFCNIACQGQSNDTTKARSFEDSAWKVYQKYFFKKSIRLLDSAIFYGSTRSFCYHLKAEALWSISEYAEAASTYKKMISFSGDDLLKVGAYVFLGMLYDKAEMPVQAKDQYTSAISFWENGYVPHKQFREYEESEYILALAMLEEKDKIKKIVSDAKEYRYQRYLEWLFKTPKELLDLHFKEYTLPDNIKPLEE